MSCIQNPNGSDLDKSSQQCEETVKQSVIKTLMVLDGMNHALDHQEKSMVARAKNLDRKTRETFIKMNPKVIKPKDSDIVGKKAKMEVAEFENDDACNNHPLVTLRLRAHQILTRAFVFLRKFHNLELNLDDQTLGPQMRPRSLSI